MISFVAVRPETAVLYSAFTFPKFLPVIQHCDVPEVVALGAEYWGKPAGLCLAALNQEKQTARLLSVAVEAEHRRMGVGSALLRAMERELLGRNCRSVVAEYLSDWPNTPALEKSLQRGGWEIRRQAMVFRGTIKPARILAQSMRNARLAPGCEIVAWSEVTAEERIAIAAARDELKYPEELSPFSEEDSIADNSIALRCRGSIAGWHIAHRVPPDYVRHSRTFVREDLRTAAQGCALIAEAVRRHSESPLADQNPNYFFHVKVDNERMLRVVQKRISCVIDSTAVAFEAVKMLCASG